jgi:hypothetical protein
LLVRVTPRAGANAVDGVGEDGELRVRVHAAPADGAANKQVIATLAKAMNCPPSLVSIRSGHTSRVKQVQVEGTSASTLAALWPGLLTRDG